MPIFELPGGSDLESSATVAPEKIDHVAAAIRRLPQQFKGKPNIEALLTMLVEPAQELEDVFWDLAYNRTLTKAVELGYDAIIDLIGKLVGEERAGKTNEDYARFINARITARRSHGLTETVIKVAKLVIDDSAATIYVQNQGTATVEVAVLNIAVDDALAETLIEFLRLTVSAGVKVYLVWSDEDPDDDPWFLWDVEGVGWDEGSFVEATD
jgi:hypothetical protein